MANPDSTVYLDQAQVVLDDLRRIAEQIGAANDRLGALREKPALLADRIKRVKNDIEEAEVTITAEVTTELESDGPAQGLGARSVTKLKFSNADARKAEVKKRVYESPVLAKLRAELAALEIEKINADIQLGGTTDSIRAYEYVHNLKVAEARLLGIVLTVTHVSVPAWHGGSDVL